MIINSSATTLINSPVRQITAKVELYNGSTLVETFKHNGDLVSFEVERIGEGKFFGYGYCQKINVKVRDVSRKYNITTANSLKVYFGDLKTLPTFYVSEVHRDENTNQLSITAYDAIAQASKLTFADLRMSAPYTMKNVASKISSLLGLKGVTYSSNTALGTEYEDGANFEGTETLRDVLDAVAEASQTIYFVSHDEYLYLRLLNIGNDGANITLSKDKYFSLECKTNRRLANITHATELGDNVSVTTGASGSTQYVRDNPFWDMREDIATLLDEALVRVGGMTINQFECSWRGNYLLELGDKLALITKDGATAYSYFLNDTLQYDGSFSQKTAWQYDNNEDETESNPSTIGEALKKTYAKVDKANKQIELVASEASGNSEKISSIELNLDSINMSVSKVENDIEVSKEELGEEIATLTKKVEATVSAEDVKLQIQSELSNGINKVETTTGFTFNDEGLTVEKSDSEMKTTITEDGMTVYKNDEAVLVADNVGVNAKNLHAITYLIIGNNSRFEDYTNASGEARTGCFWIGG